MAADRVVVPGSRRRRPSDALVRPTPADRGAARAPRGDGAGHPRTGRVTAGDGPAPGGHGPAARGPPARGRARPHDRARSPDPHDLPRAVGRARRGPRARPRGARDRPAPRVPPLRVLDGRERLHLRAAHGRLGLGRGAPGGVAGPRVRARSAGPSSSWTARSSARSGARTRPRTSRRRPGSGSRAGPPAQQLEAYGLWAGAWAAFAGGRHDEVRRLGERAVELSEHHRARSSARSSPGARSGPATPRGPPRPWPRWTPRDRLGPALAADRLRRPGRDRRPGGPRPGRAGAGTARRCARTASSGSPSTRPRRPWTWPSSCRPRSATPPTS